MPHSRRIGRSWGIAALLALLAVVGIYALMTADAGGNAGRAVAGPMAPQVQIIDGFPIGNPVPCGQHCAEWMQLARAALDKRDPNHAEVAGVRTFMEGRIPDLYGPGVVYTRSGTLTIVVFDLADGSDRATGVYCGVGGCIGWGEFPR